MAQALLRANQVADEYQKGQEGRRQKEEEEEEEDHGLKMLWEKKGKKKQKKKNKKVYIFYYYYYFLLRCHSSTSKSPGSPIRFVQLVHLHHLGSANLLNNQLCNAVARLNVKVVRAVVEQHHSQRPPIVAVHHSGAHIDKLFHRQTGTRRNPTVVARRHGNGEIRLHQHFSLARHLHKTTGKKEGRKKEEKKRARKQLLTIVAWAAARSYPAL
jgi:hypothetical protein